MADRVCPDGHACTEGCDGWACRRVRSGAPAPGVYPGDRWPRYLRQAFGRKPRPYVPKKVHHEGRDWWVIEVRWGDRTARLVEREPSPGVLLTDERGDAYPAHASTWIPLGNLVDLSDLEE